jgi:hypothetical protein
MKTHVFAITVIVLFLLVGYVSASKQSAVDGYDKLAVVKAYEKAGRDDKARILRKSLSASESTFLGFDPAKDLRQFAVEFRRQGRENEAKEMEALATWWGGPPGNRASGANYQNFLRRLQRELQN